MRVTSASLLDRLPADQPCLGAVFTSFAFSPGIFEEQVLGAVLDLRSDPTYLPDHFLDEGRAKLQSTPVVVIVDAGQRQPGRRMPYDLLEVDDRVFHPKATLLLYEDHARLQVGSGNLTRGGYGRNAELFVLLELRYDQPADALLLRQFDGFLGRCAAQVRDRGTQLDQVRDELARRLPPPASTTARPRYALLDGTLARPLLDQIFDLVPAGAAIRRVGMLAPFFEKDDEADEDSIFARIIEIAGAEIELDVGMALDNPSPSCELAQIPALDEQLGQLWCWRLDLEPEELEYMVPTRILRTRFEYRDQRGETGHWSLVDADEARVCKRLWPVGSLAAFAPARALRRASQRSRRLDTWLFPATSLRNGGPDHRPLHAKLIVVEFEHRRASRTLVVVGSANLSRAALLRGSEAGGNVETCVAFCLEGRHRLHEFAPELVSVPLELLNLREREYPEFGTNFGLCIEHARHDPGEGTLEVKWDRPRATRVGLPAWELYYGETLLSRGEGAPTEDLRCAEFVLRPDDAELKLRVGEREFAVPILVSDLAKLPVRPGEIDMNLQLLLHVLAGRIGRERAASLEVQARRAASSTGAAMGLAAIFGADFGPVDVLRAWWGACAELRDRKLTVHGFRVAFVGCMGLEVVWTKMLAAATTEPPSLSQAQVWFYGAELARELSRISLDDDPAGRAKAAILEPFIERLRSDLASLTASVGDQGWMRHVIEFYGVSP
jgi:hypothetical protein